MIATSKVTQKNQTTIPRVVIDALGIKPADRIYYEIEEGRVILHAKTEPLSDLKGRFRGFGRKPAYPVSVDEMHEAVGEAVAEKGSGYGERRQRRRKRKARRT